MRDLASTWPQLAGAVLLGFAVFALFRGLAIWLGRDKDIR